MQDDLTNAIRALKIDVPVLNWTIQNGRVTLLLYGGQVRIWEMDESESVPGAELAALRPAASKTKQTSLR